jgi:hypothetical protein
MTGLRPKALRQKPPSNQLLTFFTERRVFVTGREYVPVCRTPCSGGCNDRPESQRLRRSGIVPAFHMISMCMENPSPCWPGAHADFNREATTSTDFKMDGFVTASSVFAISRGFYDKQGSRTMGYYPADDLPYYYLMASNFATSDRWFCPVLAETPPNRLYLMSATSVGHVYPSCSSLLFDCLSVNWIGSGPDA